MVAYILGKSFLFLCFVALNAAALGITLALIDTESKIAQTEALFWGGLRVSVASWLLRSLLSPVTWMIAAHTLFIVLAVPAFIAALAYREKTREYSLFGKDRDRLCKVALFLALINLAASSVAPGACF